MKKSMLTVPFFISGGLLLSCNGTTDSIEDKPNNSASTSTETNSESDNISYVYASVDTLMEVNQTTYHVHVDQLDLTDQATQDGDLRPGRTYVCVMEIELPGGEVLYSDTLYRDSWGYKGKIESIDAYQMALPQISSHENEIIASYYIFEYNSLDAISGNVAFDTNSKKVRLFWEESYIE